MLTQQYWRRTMCQLIWLSHMKSDSQKYHRTVSLFQGQVSRQSDSAKKDVVKFLKFQNPCFLSTLSSNDKNISYPINLLRFSVKHTRTYSKCERDMLSGGTCSPLRSTYWTSLPPSYPRDILLPPSPSQSESQLGRTTNRARLLSFLFVHTSTSNAVDDNEIDKTSYFIEYCKDTVPKIWNTYSQNHVAVRDLYIPTMSQPILLQQNMCFCGPTNRGEYINRSQIHECGSWERGRAV